jgi:hypothetical protein
LSNGGASASASGGTTPYSYSWSNAATTASITGISASTYTVTVTDKNNCTATAQASISQPTALSATAKVDTSVSCAGVQDGQVSVSASGGTSPYSYAWNNSSTNNINASIGIGTYTVTVTDSNSCTQIDSIVLGYSGTYTPPTVTFPNPSAICANDTDRTLSGATPTGGVYTGINVSNGKFSPSSAGTDTLYYTYTDSIGCKTTDTAFIVVNATPVVSFTSLNAICADNSAFPITGGMPSGGTYSGTGVNSNIFYPDTAGVGSHKIVYRYTDSNNCSDTASQTQVVDTIPVVTFSMQANWCLNASPIKLTGGIPQGGSYLVNGVSDTVYKSIVSGTDTVVYTFTDSNNCTSTDTAMIAADTVPMVSFGSLNDVCVGSGRIALSTGLPSGGNYSGLRVANGAYSPSVVGTDTLTYIFIDGNSCSDTSTQTITVHALPVVSLASMNAVCENTPVFNLSGGMPAGGAFSGAGVNSGSFNASAAGLGLKTITYTYTDVNNCTDSAQQSLTVHAVTQANFRFLLRACDNHDPVDLSSNGTPSGGVFSGVAVTGNNFDPQTAGVGTHTLKYVYTNTNNCQDSATQTITVETSPVFNVVGVKLDGCNNSPAVLTTSLSGNAQYSFKWQDGSSGDTAFIRQAGSIWVKVTDQSTHRLCANIDTIAGLTYEEICVGLEQVFTNSRIDVFPNPTRGIVNYQIEGLEGYPLNIRVLSPLGAEIYNSRIEEVGVLEQGILDLGHVENGVYMMVLSSNGDQRIIRINVAR